MRLRLRLRLFKIYAELLCVHIWPTNFTTNSLFLVYVCTLYTYINTNIINKNERITFCCFRWSKLSFFFFFSSWWFLSSLHLAHWHLIHWMAGFWWGCVFVRASRAWTAANIGTFDVDERRLCWKREVLRFAHKHFNHLPHMWPETRWSLCA